MNTLIGGDGREYASVVVARSRPFARACVEVMAEQDGEDRRYYLRWKSFWVPREVIDLARARLSARNQ